MNKLGHQLSRYPLAAALIAMSLVMLAVVSFENLEHKTAYQTNRSNVVATAATIRARMEGLLNSTLLLTHGLSATVAVRGSMDKESFARLAREYVSRSPHIRNVALAPDNVIRLIYPLEGNEKALGLDYFANPEQREPVIMAMESGKVVVAGPLDLVQGGRGLIARQPIYLSPEGQSPRTGRYWGMASVVINMDSVLQAAGITASYHGLDIALRGEDGLGPRGEVFYGDPDLFMQDPVLLNIAMPETGSWQMAVKPKTGWVKIDDHSAWFHAFEAALIAITGFLVFYSLNSARQSHYVSLHDVLTGLANRRLFESHLDKMVAWARREQSRIGVIVINLEQFRHINEQYNHRIGDAVLKVVAQRLSLDLRESDLAARIGGDEFAVLVSSVRSQKDILVVCNKLKSDLSRPLHMDGKVIEFAVRIGFALYPEDAERLDTLLSVADARMYNTTPHPDDD